MSRLPKKAQQQNQLVKILFGSLTMVALLSACGGGSSASSSTETTPVDPQALALDQPAHARVIYGQDNRLDLSEVTDIHRVVLADSTVALMATNDLVDDNGTTRIHAVPYATIEGTPLCATEKFRAQSSAAFCSGFLIAPDLIATAGHCIRSDEGDLNDCSTTKIVFGFSIVHGTETPTSIPSTEVYACKKIIKREETASAQDYAVIQLDRPVSNHAPLSIRKTGDPALTDQLMVIGHPSGLPTKIADGALIRAVLPSYIRASLDTYAGNSGSAVFNVRTNTVEGILVRGEQDFVMQGNCLVSKVCDQGGCRGEDSTRISFVVPYATNLDPAE